MGTGNNIPYKTSHTSFKSYSTGKKKILAIPTTFFFFFLLASLFRLVKNQQFWGHAKSHFVCIHCWYTTYYACVHRQVWHFRSKRWTALTEPSPCTYTQLYNCASHPCHSQVNSINCFLWAESSSPDWRELVLLGVQVGTRWRSTVLK